MSDDFFTADENEFLNKCWEFLSKKTRIDGTRLPPKSGIEFSRLEARLLAEHTQNQAGLFRFPNYTIGDAGVACLFPGFNRMEDVTEEKWKEFSSKTKNLILKIDSAPNGEKRRRLK